MTGILLTAACTLIVLLLFIFTIKKLLDTRAGSGASASEIEKCFSRIENILREESGRNRSETGQNLKSAREELNNSLKNHFDTFSKEFKNLSGTNEEKLEKMRHTVESKLEEVYKGFGEMRSLAIGVGDLKKVLANVKTKGIVGEYHLGNILEQILAPSQYEKNVATKKGSNDPVEFAVKMPGRDNDENPVWLPIDSKFPLESYGLLMDAYEKAEPEMIKKTLSDLEGEIRKNAKKIREKYLDPPNTTDFAVMFLPIEGLFAEVIRKPGLFESLQRDLKITIAGPTTLAAFLNSLQMGFRTLAIEKRSSEVWNLLGAVKTEFGKFGEMLADIDDSLRAAGNKLQKAAGKSHTIERKLRDVQELPSNEAIKLLEEPVENDEKPE